MEDDHKLLTMDQWNEWWEKDYNRSKSGEKQDTDDTCDTCDEFTQLSPMLQKHKTAFLSDHPGRRVLVPLCGKSPDMKWLSDEGHYVIGIECSEHAILEFFEGNSIEFDKVVSQVDATFNAFVAKDAKITLYQGDFFKLTPELIGGKVDAVWDTASLNTIDLSLRKPYVAVMTALLNPDARYLLSAMYFGDKKTWNNNPFDITEQDLVELFGSAFTWELIDRDDSEWGLEQLFLMKHK